MTSGASITEWLTAIGTVGAVIVALAVAWMGRGQASEARKQAQEAHREAREARASVVRDRTAARIVELMAVVETDLTRPEPFEGSMQGRALCYSLRNRVPLGAVWHAYCEPDRRWIHDLTRNGQLASRLRGELVDALDRLDEQDLPPVERA